MSASYCGACGKQFQSNDIFCAGCGTPRDDTNVLNTTLASGPNAPTILSSAAPLGRAPQAAEPANSTKVSAAVCELKVSDRSCGIQAVGRCVACGRAFCATHQAWSGQTYYIDQCAPCFTQAQADKKKRIREAEAQMQADEAEARKYIQSGSARTALLTSGVQAATIYQTRRKLKKGFFSQNSQWVEEIASVRRGWILGVISGKHSAQLTALLDLNHPQVVLTPVEPYAESYKEVGIDWEKVDSSWIEAAQAIRQLIRLRHLGIQSIFARRIHTKQGEYSSKRMQPLAGKSGFIRIEQGKEPGRMYEIQKGELSIGRSRDRDIFLEDSAMNELQATIINHGNGNYALRVDSADEFYCTMVNGQILPPNKARGSREPQTYSQTYPLQDGDHIQFSVRVSIPQILWQMQNDGELKLPDQTVLVFGTK